MPPHRLFPPPCPDKNIRHIIHHYIRNAILVNIFMFYGFTVLNLLYCPLYFPVLKAIIYNPVYFLPSTSAPVWKSLQRLYITFRRLFRQSLNCFLYSLFCRSVQTANIFCGFFAVLYPHLFSSLSIFSAAAFLARLFAYMNKLLIPSAVFGVSRVSIRITSPSGKEISTSSSANSLLTHRLSWGVSRWW